ncbi:hypothetical protein EMIT0P12_10980 [Pseudomonas sp. IT-P12]
MRGCERISVEIAGTKKEAEASVFWLCSVQWNAAKRYLERETRLELATPTLARSCSTN